MQRIRQIDRQKSERRAGGILAVASFCQVEFFEVDGGDEVFAGDVLEDRHEVEHGVVQSFFFDVGVKVGELL